MELFCNGYTNHSPRHSRRAWSNDVGDIGFRAVYCDQCGYAGGRHRAEGTMLHPSGLTLHSGTCSNEYFTHLPPEVDFTVFVQLLVNYGTD